MCYSISFISFDTADSPVGRDCQVHLVKIRELVSEGYITSPRSHRYEVCGGKKAQVCMILKPSVSAFAFRRDQGREGWEDILTLSSQVTPFAK